MTAGGVAATKISGIIPATTHRAGRNGDRSIIASENRPPDQLYVDGRREAAWP